MKKLLDKATVMRKRQVTIPKKIYDYLDIHTCQIVIFETQNNNINLASCFICRYTYPSLLKIRDELQIQLIKYFDHSHEIPAEQNTYKKNNYD